jgi:hypothetical protein
MNVRETYLINLIHEGERSTRFFRQTHQVQNGCQGSFLQEKQSENRRLVFPTEASVDSWKTYTARLPLTGQQLQLFVGTERDIDFDGPLLEIFVFSDANLTSTANA